ncbi:hypothetical protein [Photorhabdus sp. SF281]|uniref:hypothetical protein n=1 Tax=Photorhabdus sp. SF281 TaxID=3459527 RepID=UPI004044ABE1
MKIYHQNTPENHEVFGTQNNQHNENAFPKTRMVCHMELTSHQLINGVFVGYKTNKMTLTEELMEKTPDNSLTLFDKDYYSLELLNRWHKAGKQRHWLLPYVKTWIMKFFIALIEMGVIDLFTLHQHQPEQ